MTKKDYIILSGIVEDAKGIKRADDAVAYIAHEIARACAVDNPRFDRERFLSACGLEG